MITLIHELGITESVTFAGFRSDIEHILSALDVYVSFTTNDTLSISVLEAMAMGRPIIGADSGGMAELVLHEKTGLLVDLGDLEGLVHAMMRLLSSPDLRHSMGMAGQK